MYIHKLEINGFSTFNKFELELNKNLNIIVGTNGVGKTNLLRIISAALMDFEILKDYFNDVDDSKYINIYLKFEDNEIDFLNNLYIFSFLCKLFTYVNNKSSFINIEDIAKDLFSIQTFNFNGIILEFTYRNNEIKRQIKNMNDGYCNKHNKYAQYMINMNFFNYNECDNNCHNKKIFAKCRDNDDNYTKNIIVNNIIYEEMTYFTDIILQDFKHYSNSLNEIIDLLNKCKINKSSICDLMQLKLIQTEKDINFRNIEEIEELIFTYIENKFNNNLLSDEEKNIDDIITTVCKIPQHININVFNKNYFKENIFDLSKDYEMRHILFEIKNTDIKTFKEIQKSFHNITLKHFDVNLKHTDSIMQDYCYVVSIEKDYNYYNCSNGEKELINFLGLYFNYYNNNIILIDEPCTKLSSQNKINFVDIIFKNNDDKKQFIIVTHDKELIDINMCGNITHFRLERNTTIATKIENNNGEINRLIFEYPEILFSNKVLLIEGFTDYVFMKQFLRACTINDYEIIIMYGCGNTLWKILDLLNIKYKIIYDTDRIVNITKKTISKKNVNPEEIKIDSKSIKFMLTRE